MNSSVKMSAQYSVEVKKARKGQKEQKVKKKTKNQKNPNKTKPLIKLLYESMEILKAAYILGHLSKRKIE